MLIGLLTLLGFSKFIPFCWAKFYMFFFTMAPWSVVVILWLWLLLLLYIFHIGSLHWRSKCSWKRLSSTISKAHCMICKVFIYMTLCTVNFGISPLKSCGGLYFTSSNKGHQFIFLHLVVISSDWYFIAGWQRAPIHFSAFRC